MAAARTVAMNPVRARLVYRLLVSGVTGCDPPIECGPAVASVSLRLRRDWRRWPSPRPFGSPCDSSSSLGHCSLTIGERDPGWGRFRRHWDAAPPSSVGRPAFGRCSLIFTSAGGPAVNIVKPSLSIAKSLSQWDPGITDSVPRGPPLFQRPIGSGKARRRSSTRGRPAQSRHG
jgi:hypothetical protein